MDRVELEPVPPYSLSRTVGAFSRFPNELVDRVERDTYRRAFASGDGVVLLEASQPEDTDPNGPVTVMAHSVSGSPDVAAAIQCLSHTLAISEAIEPVYRAGSSNSAVTYLTRRLRGLRRTLDPTPFEGLVSSILAQLISIRAASVIRSRFVQRFGRSIEHEHDVYWVFPEPERVAGTSIDELCGLGMTRAKARAILGVAELAANGRLVHDRLAQLGDSEVMATLTALPGIGPWTAEWFLVNVLGRMAIVPAGDLGIRRATGRWLLDGSMPSPDEVRAVYEPYGDRRGYVAYYVLSAERYRLDPP